MADPKTVATNMIDGTMAVLTGTPQFKADVVGEVVDQLLGDDPHALVRGAPGLPPAMFEPMSDWVILQLKVQLLKRLTQPALPPPAPAAPYPPLR